MVRIRIRMKQSDPYQTTYPDQYQIEKQDLDPDP